MKIAPLAEVKAQLSAYIEQCATQGPIVITRNGRAVAVLLAPTDDDDLEGSLLSRSPRFRSLLERSRESIKQGDDLLDEEFWQAVDARAQDESLVSPAA
jgi:prevent-host-death family protein